MEEQLNTVEQQETAHRPGARITLPTEHMTRTKSASGGISFHCGDAVAQALAGLSLDHVKTLASEALNIDCDKYNHLNPGQQRMTLGNLIRNMTRRDESLIEPFNSVLLRVQGLAEQEAKIKAEVDAAESAAKEKAKKEAEDLKQKKKADAQAAKDKREAEKKEKADKRDADKKARAEEKAKKAADRDQKKKDREAEKLKKAEERQAEKDRKALEKQQKAAASVGDANQQEDLNLGETAE